MTPRRITWRPGGDLDGRPLRPSPRGADGGSAAEHRAGRGGTGGYNLRSPGPRSMSTATGEKYRGLADGAFVQGEWERAGGTVMA